nr:MAG TPA: hypothetical protein [Caudoviricetes sp.]
MTASFFLAVVNVLVYLFLLPLIVWDSVALYLLVSTFVIYMLKPL